MKMECPSSQQVATHLLGERQGEYRKLRLHLFPPALEISWQEIESLTMMCRTHLKIPCYLNPQLIISLPVCGYLKLFIVKSK